MHAFRVLGPLAVEVDGAVVTPTSTRQRRVLAVLLLRAGRPVSMATIVDAVWGTVPPRSAVNSAQSYVSRLRSLVGPEVLVWTGSGYRLAVEPASVDAYRFERLVEAARSAPEPAEALASLDEALALWGGDAYPELAHYHPGMAETARLDELRIAAQEQRAEALLAADRSGEAVAALRALTREQPLRERPWRALMLALHRAGRQAEALSTYRAYDALLAEQGLTPGATIAKLRNAILATPEVVRGTPQPAAGARTPPAQLPIAVVDFIGRHADLSWLDDLLGDGAAGGPTTGAGIAVLAGTAGVGKTALAVTWAHRVHARFPDGQLYVDLGGFASDTPVRPIDALTGFLHALDVPAERIPADLGQAAAMYRTLLARKRMLVLLDNAVSADQVRPLLPGEPACLALVTSRNALGGLVAREGARRRTVGLLSAPEARLLLTGILGRQRTQAEAQVVDELARMCAYLPLALRIAAANLHGHPERSIAAHVAVLAESDRLDLLAVEGDEQAAVRGAFATSYLALDPETRRFFRLLGLVPGADITTEGAASLADLAPEPAARILHRLAAAHLVTEPTAGRYALHDLLRCYAADRARVEDDAAQRRAAVGRLVDWYVDAAYAAARALHPSSARLAPDPGPAAVSFDGETAALTWLDAERANLRSVVGRAVEHGPDRATWLLADALRRYFWRRTSTADWLAIARAGLAAAELAGDAGAQAAAQLSLADAELRRDRYRQALAHYRRAASLCRDVGWLDWQCSALGMAGVAYSRWGRVRDAIRSYTLALAAARRAERPDLEAGALVNLGLACFTQGDLSLASTHSTRALDLFQRLEFRQGVAIALANLSEVDLALGHPDTALARATRALAMHREIGDQVVEPEALRILAEIHRDTGRNALALDCARDALALARDRGDAKVEATALSTMATIEERLGRYREAAEQQRLALVVARKAGLRFAEITALVGMAQANRGLGNLDQVRSYVRLALTLAETAGYELLAGQAQVVLAATLTDLGQPAPAAELAVSALRRLRDCGHRLGIAHALVALGRAVRDADPGTAVDHWRQALGILADIRAPGAEDVHRLLDELTPARR